MGRTLISVAGLALAAASARASTIRYVTDMPVYDGLATCIKSAISLNIQYLTNDKCPEAVTELQSCVCTKNNNRSSISAQISSSISRSCGSAASDDHSTAQSVLSAYCDPDKTLTFSTPTAVDAYITELPEIKNLAPCAQSALMYAVRTMTYSLCPEEPPALANCACSKNQNSLFVSQIINASADYHCSGRTADISSAQAFFAAYCAMDAGTTSFPQPSRPPGDMTYYITDLPGYSSLAGCAATALSMAAQDQSSEYCPSGPQALASCLCLKDGMTNDISRSITSSVRDSCSPTASDDVASALAVYSYYCSAAAAEVTAVGVTNSVEQSTPGSRTQGGPKQTDGSGNVNGDESGGSTQGGDTEDSEGLGTGVIVGAVVGAIGGLGVLGAIIFFIIRAKRGDRPGSMKIPDDPPVPLTPYGGKHELASDSVAAPPPPPSPSPSMLKAGAMVASPNTVSPVSANTGGAYSPPSNQAELSAQSALYPPMPNRPELHSQPTGTPPPPELQGQTMFAAPPPNAPELYGQGAPQVNRPELQGQGVMYAAPPNAPELYGQGAAQPNRPELQGQGAMYAPTPANTSELAGQGSQIHNANPNRPELMGQSSYHQSPTTPYLQQQQQQSPYPSPSHSPHPQQQHMQAQGYNNQAYYPGTPPPPPPQQQQNQLHPQASWQSGPVPDLHEMDGQPQR